MSADSTASDTSASWRRLGDRSLKLRVLLPVVLGCLATIGTATTGYTGERSLADHSAALLVDSRTLANHLRGDMMHDAIKADVLAVLLARAPEERSAAMADLAEHADTFVQMQDENARLMTDPALLEGLAAARPALDAYIDQARGIAATATSDTEGARRQLPEFLAAFDALADSQETLSERIDSHNGRTAASAEQAADDGGRKLLATVLIALTLTLGLGLLVVRSVLRPVGRLLARLTRFGQGDFSAPAEQWDADELGDMGRALERTQVALAATVSTIADSAAGLAAAAQELTSAADTFAEGAGTSSSRSGMVAAAAEQVSRNVQTVAAGSEEMDASIREISENAHAAARVGDDAVLAAQATDATVRRLAESSREIGVVIKTITSIAEQTNMLALNATIEAARAGESGKGFAVVASEVKDLARDTAAATEDIGRRVEAIQSDSAGAAAAIEEIGQVVARIKDFQTAIAGAVEEQTATTKEMSRNVSEAAVGSGQIAQNITDVATAAEATSYGVQRIQDAAGAVRGMSGELQRVVGTFRT